jgi:post-segregation antitoxin (ccd killing protein)
MSPKEVFSIRLDPDLLKKAQALGVNISGAVQSMLEKLVKEKACPTCGQKVKK